MTTRNRTFLTLAAVAMACFAMTTAANAGVITQTDAIGFPSELPPIANDDLLQTNLTSVTATTPRWGAADHLADGAGDIASDAFTYGSTYSYSPGNNKAGVYQAVFVLDDHFDIGEIRVTAGSGDGLRSDQDWDVYTSSDSGSTWNALRMDNILFDGPGGHGKGTSITLTDDTGTLGSNVDAIKFDIFGAGGGTSYHAGYQEIDIFEAAPAPGGIEVGATAGTWDVTRQENPQPEILEVDKTAVDMDPFDMEITVTGGLPAITIDETVLNETMLDWTDYHVQLGTGLGIDFIPSIGGDGLLFLGGTSLTFPTVTPLGEDELAFSGSIVGPLNSDTLQLQLQVPGTDPYTFTLRQWPTMPTTVIPEPSTFAIWALGLLGLAWYARRRRKRN